MSKMVTRRTTAEFAKQKINKALMDLSEAIAALENSLYEDFYDKAFNDGVEWVKSEFKKIDAIDELDPQTVAPATLSDVEKFVDQSIYSFILNNPGLRTTDIILSALKLPVKPALTEPGVKGTINRLKREGKIDNKAGRWYSTQAKNNGQQYQVMAYLPDGSKYLGTDVIKENV